MKHSPMEKSPFGFSVFPSPQATPGNSSHKTQAGLGWAPQRAKHPRHLSGSSTSRKSPKGQKHKTGMESPGEFYSPPEKEDPRPLLSQPGPAHRPSRPPAAPPRRSGRGWRAGVAESSPGPPAGPGSGPAPCPAAGRSAARPSRRPPPPGRAGRGGRGRRRPPAAPPPCPPRSWPAPGSAGTGRAAPCAWAPWPLQGRRRHRPSSARPAPGPGPGPATARPLSFPRPLSGPRANFVRRRAAGLGQDLGRGRLCLLLLLLPQLAGPSRRSGAAAPLSSSSSSVWRPARLLSAPSGDQTTSPPPPPPLACPRRGRPAAGLPGGTGDNLCPPLSGPGGAAGRESRAQLQAPPLTGGRAGAAILATQSGRRDRPAAPQQRIPSPATTATPARLPVCPSVRQGRPCRGKEPRPGLREVLPLLPLRGSAGTGRAGTGSPARVSRRRDKGGAAGPGRAVLRPKGGSRRLLRIPAGICPEPRDLFRPKPGKAKCRNNNTWGPLSGRFWKKQKFAKEL